jgi:hypothetical protein
MRLLKILIPLCTVLLFVSCDRVPETEKPVLKVILDTDMGSDCDDVGALAMLHEYAREGAVEILGIIYSSGAVPYGAGIVDAINVYYGRPDIPIGACYDSTFGDPVDKMLAEKLSKDTAAFGNSIIHNREAPEQTQLLRKLLADAEENSIIYITIGHTKGLYDLLVSQPDSISPSSGYELARAKIQKWIALGALNAYNGGAYHARDWNFFFNKTAAFTKHLVDSFPKPMYFVSGGRDIMTGKTLMHTPSGNILRTAYRDWLWNVEQKTLSDQRPSWDLLAVLFAVEGPDQYFEVVSNGYLDVDVSKGSMWVEMDTVTQHHFVLQKQGTDLELADYFNEIIARQGN